MSLCCHSPPGGAGRHRSASHVETSPCREPVASTERSVGRAHACGKPLPPRGFLSPPRLLIIVVEAVARIPRVRDVASYYIWSNSRSAHSAPARSPASIPRTGDIPRRSALGLTEGCRVWWNVRASPTRPFRILLWNLLTTRCPLPRASHRRLTPPTAQEGEEVTSSLTRNPASGGSGFRGAPCAGVARRRCSDPTPRLALERMGKFSVRLPS